MRQDSGLIANTLADALPLHFVLYEVAAQTPMQGEAEVHTKQKQKLTFTMALQCGVQTRVSLLETVWERGRECVGH